MGDSFKHCNHEHEKTKMKKRRGLEELLADIQLATQNVEE
jgi:hypothetical protein